MKIIKTGKIPPEPWRCLHEKRGLTNLETKYLRSYLNHIRAGRKPNATKLLLFFREHAEHFGC